MLCPALRIFSVPHFDGSRSGCNVVAASARPRLAWIGVIAILALAAPAATSRADIVLVNGNSQLTINPQSSLGLNQWSVDGRNYMTQDWFWYGFGSSGGQQALNTLSLSMSSASDTDGDGYDDTAVLKYASSANGLTATLKYSLVGGDSGSGTSDLGLQIKLSNTGSTSVALHFVQYANLAMGSTDTLQFDNTSHSDDIFQSATIGTINTTINMPLPSEYEAGLASLLLPKVSSGGSLNDNANAGQGDVASALQWDVSLAPTNGSFVIGEDIHIADSVPEPSALVLLAVGAAGALCAAWRRRLS